MWQLFLFQCCVIISIYALSLFIKNFMQVYSSKNSKYLVIYFPCHPTLQSNHHHPHWVSTDPLPLIFTPSPCKIPSRKLFVFCVAWCPIDWLVKRVHQERVLEYKCRCHKNPWFEKFKQNLVFWIEKMKIDWNRLKYQWPKK